MVMPYKDKAKRDERNRERYKANREQRVARQKQYAKDNPEAIRERSKKYRERNSEKIQAAQKDYYERNRDALLAQKKEYHAQNREIIIKKLREHHSKNKEKIAAGNKRWREENPDYDIKRRQASPYLKFAHRVRTLVGTSFSRSDRKFKKSKKTEEILGCTVVDFSKHLESRFTEGMSLDNHGEWHIDHIVPLATAKTEEDVIRLNHYTNLQPLWAIDNLKKGAKVA